MEVEIQRALSKGSVVIGIDQFRASYLEGYGTASSGAFRRPLEQGRHYPSAIVDHAPTLSDPGHTTLATGAYSKGFSCGSCISWSNAAAKPNSDPSDHFAPLDTLKEEPGDSCQGEALQFHHYGRIARFRQNEPFTSSGEDRHEKGHRAVQNQGGSGR